MIDPNTPAKKILLVEDDEQLQSSYLKLFKAENYEVLQAFTGEQGLELAKSDHPDIILLDIMLKGGTNGFDVLENLKKNRDLFNIPVLMLTNLDSERKLALSIGAVDYLVKANTSIDVLLEKVRSYIDKQPDSLADDSQFTAPRPDGSDAQNLPHLPPTPPMTTEGQVAAAPATQVPETPLATTPETPAPETPGAATPASTESQNPPAGV